MNKETFIKALTEFAEQVRSEKGPNACTVFCKLKTPAWFPPKHLMFAMAFESCVRGRQGATEEAWRIYELHQRLRRSS
jgi:hypothetical protein